MDGLVYLLVIFLGCCLFSGLGWWIATQKNRSEVEGVILGFLFGPFGCLIEAVLPTIAVAPKPKKFHQRTPIKSAYEWNEEDPEELKAMEYLGSVEPQAEETAAQQRAKQDRDAAKEAAFLDAIAEGLHASKAPQKFT